MPLKIICTIGTQSITLAKARPIDPWSVTLPDGRKFVCRGSKSRALDVARQHLLPLPAQLGAEP